MLSSLKTTMKIINILLKYGADVQFTEEIGHKTIFDFATFKNIAVMKYEVDTRAPGNAGIDWQTDHSANLRQNRDN